LFWFFQEVNKHGREKVDVGRPRCDRIVDRRHGRVGIRADMNPSVTCAHAHD
jgi:hypothetical protein